MKTSRFAFLSAGALICLRLGSLAAPPPPSAAPTDVVPELANASLSELRNALNEISDESIEAARNARDLTTALNASLVNSTVSTPEIDALRARRDELIRDLSNTEAALRAAILASDEYKERAAEAESAREKAESLAARRTAIRALLAIRRREASAPPPKPVPAAPAPAPAAEP